MKISKIRLQEIAGIETDDTSDDVNETRAFTTRELEQDAMELLHKIGLKNPTNDQMKSVIELLADLIKKSGAGTMLVPALQFSANTKA